MAIAVTMPLISVATADGAIGVWHLAPVLALFGIGMGQIFVPLFSIVMGDVEDHEVGSGVRSAHRAGATRRLSGRRPPAGA